MNPDLVHSLNSLRTLSIDMISQANSGHPGICLGAAPIIYSIYANHLKVNPVDPKWINRDRFVMSCGHGSALLYATLFMAGYDISIDDLVNFRRLGSKTPGHPEYGVTPGVEVSTGPLGQGFANAVGMAIAERYLAALFEEKIPKQKVVDYYVYCLASEGDLMEGVALEAAAVAGNLGLDRLIVLYDSNDVTLDGDLKLSSTNDDIIKKYIAMGWEVDYVQEGNDTREIDKAIVRAKYNKKPTLIEVKTVLGRGSINEGNHIVHGKPLTRDDIAQLKKKLNITTNHMEITENAVKYLRLSIANRINTPYNEWQRYFKNIKKDANAEVTKLINFIEKQDIGMTFTSKSFKIQNDYMEELRESNSKLMNIISDRTKFFLGGSADLSSSCHTNLYKEIEMSKKYPAGKNMYFGVREHAMGAILNGMALSGLRVYGSTFLVFSDYLKPAMRMSAMMELPVTYVLTHDSIGIGQDGPTHQPIEQLAMIRSIPRLVDFRPCDINEVVGCWDYIINNKRPAAIVLSKDEAHILSGTSGENTMKGAYVIRKEKEKIDAVVVATGLEVTTALLISEELKQKGIDLRIVSMPSMKLFLEQTEAYRKEIIPDGVKVITLESGSTMPWYRFTKPEYTIGVNDFGYSGTKDEVLEKMGFDYESILKRIEEIVHE